MKENAQKGFIELIVVALIALIVGGVAVFIWHTNEVEKSAQRAEQAAREKAKAEQVAKSPCDKIENERGCVVNGFEVVSPNGGEELCIGSSYTVKWKAPADMEAVTLRVRESGLGSNGYSLGTFRADKGEFIWKIEAVKPGEVYKLWLNSVYKGSSVNESSDKLFTLKSC